MVRDTSNADADSNSPHKNPYFVDRKARSASVQITKPSPWQWVYLVAATLAPFAITACYIVVTRELIVVGTTWDFVGLGGSLATGIYCLWQLPISQTACVLSTMIYIPVMGASLVFFSLGFIGQRYNLWI